MYHKLMYNVHKSMLDSLVDDPATEEMRKHHVKRMAYHLYKMK